MAGDQLISNQGDFSEVDWAAIGPLVPCLPFFHGARVVPTKEHYHDEHVRMVNGVMKPQVGVVVRPPREFLKHWARSHVWDIFYEDFVMTRYRVPSKSIVVWWGADSRCYSYRAGDEVGHGPDQPPVFETAMLVTLQDVQNTQGDYIPGRWANEALSVTREFFNCIDEVVQEMSLTSSFHITAVKHIVERWKHREWAEVNTMLESPIFAFMHSLIRKVPADSTCWMPPPGEVCILGLKNGLIATRRLQILNMQMPSTPPSALSLPVIILSDSPVDDDDEPDL